MPFVPRFLPSLAAPLFQNDGYDDLGVLHPWPPGTSVDVSIEGLPSVSLDATQFGLCGGMCFLTRDIFEAGTAQLRGGDCTKIPLALADYLVIRTVQAFGAPGTVVRWYQLTMLPDGDGVLGAGVFHQTVEECAAIMADIDAGTLSPIGVVLVNSVWPGDVFGNHVELVYGYDMTPGGLLTLHVYDPNNPGADNITISLDTSSPTQPSVVTTNGTHIKNQAGVIRGFFRLGYTHVDPSPAYIDDAAVYVVVNPPAEMMPGATATAAVVAANTGSTNWTSAQQIRLGSQAPQDSTTWGITRLDLPFGQVDAQGGATFHMTITAPSAPGTYPFSWQMVRDPDVFFGTPSAPATEITVQAAVQPVVPGVVGMSVAEAEQAITAAGLTYRVEFTLNGSDPGFVASQQPPGRTLTTPGAVVTIWITETKGPPP